MLQQEEQVIRIRYELVRYLFKSTIHTPEANVLVEQHRAGKESSKRHSSRDITVAR